MYYLFVFLNIYVEVLNMICDRIQKLRKESGLSQAELARKLSVTRSSVNAWEMGFSAPSAQYIIKLANLFHCTSDYILELDNNKNFSISEYSERELKLIRDLASYIDANKKRL